MSRRWKGRGWGASCGQRRLGKGIAHHLSLMRAPKAATIPQEICAERRRGGVRTAAPQREAVLLPRTKIRDSHDGPPKRLSMRFEGTSKNVSAASRGKDGEERTDWRHRGGVVKGSGWLSHKLGKKCPTPSRRQPA